MSDSFPRYPRPDDPRPEHQDDVDQEDVHSDHLVETQESLRDDDPEAPALDRGVEATDLPLGAEKFGTTHAEELAGESLEYRLSQEVPDIGEHDPVEDIVAADPTTFANDSVDAEQTDDQLLGDAYGGSDGRDDDLLAAEDPVGRLVEPDEGAHTDTEKDMLASDVGRDGGDLSAEELALHLEPER